MVSGKLTHDAVEDERGDYVPKCILVTGGAGFIASHVVIRLMKSFPDYKVLTESSQPDINTHKHVLVCMSL